MTRLVIILVSMAMSAQVTLVLGEHRNFAFHHSGEEAQPEILAGQRKALNLRYSRAGRLLGGGPGSRKAIDPYGRFGKAGVI